MPLPAIPTASLLCRLVLEVYALLVPSIPDEAGAARVCAWPPTAATPLPECWSRGAPEDPVRVDQTGRRALVVRLPERWLSTDEVELDEVVAAPPSLRVRLKITRPDSPDGEPAPRDLLVAVPLDPALARFDHLVIGFAGRRRTMDGRLLALAVALPEPVAVALSSP